MSAAPHLEPLEVQAGVTEYATKGVRKNVRANLRLVSPLRVNKASNSVFILVLLGTLGLGMLGVLVINTSLAQGAFTLGELRSEHNELVRTEATLTEEVAVLSAPDALETQARAIGMVPSTTPAFIQIPDGTVLGKPKPAKGARIATPADATVGEAVDAAAAAELPESLGADYDPAAADAQANEEAQAQSSKKSPKNEAGVWSEPTFVDAEVLSEDALLDAVPVP